MDACYSRQRGVSLEIAIANHARIPRIVIELVDVYLFANNFEILFRTILQLWHESPPGSGKSEVKRFKITTSLLLTIAPAIPARESPYSTDLTLDQVSSSPVYVSDTWSLRRLPSRPRTFSRLLSIFPGGCCE